MAAAGVSGEALGAKGGKGVCVSEELSGHLGATGGHWQGMEVREQRKGERPQRLTGYGVGTMAALQVQKACVFLIFNLVYFKKICFCSSLLLGASNNLAKERYLHGF